MSTRLGKYLNINKSIDHTACDTGVEIVISGAFSACGGMFSSISTCNNYDARASGVKSVAKTNQKMLPCLKTLLPFHHRP